MRLRDDRRGFVLSGIALLLVLPAMLLAASCFSIIGTGGKTASLQALSDKATYTGRDIERIIEYMADNKLATDSSTLGMLAENYHEATGLLVEIMPPPHTTLLVEEELDEDEYFNFETLLYGLRLEIEAENTGSVIKIYDFDFGDLENEDVQGTSFTLSLEQDNILVELIVEEGWIRVRYTLLGGQARGAVIDVRDPQGATQYSSIARFGVQLDQSYPRRITDKWHNVVDNSWMTQTFVAGLTGPLTKVTLYLMREGSPGSLTVEIRGCTGAEDPPDNTVLASRTTSNVTSATGQEYEFTFASPVSVTAGTYYSIVLHEPAGGTSSDRYRWAEYTYYDNYLGGHVWKSSNGGGSWTVGGSGIHDFYFRTYVNVEG